jgi:dTDP-4-amino-4,6-dideoxygalactose transaminase
MNPICGSPALTLDDLAIATGRPHFSELLHIGRPNVGSEELLLDRIRGMLRRRWFTNNGPLVLELEARLAHFLGVRHCILTSNATIALELAFRALELSGEVIVPSFTFVATVHALQWIGVKPVFCDIEPSSHNLDPEHAARLITPRTSAIVGVHLWGKACAHQKLAAIAAQHRLRLIFDASHAFACSSNGQLIGSLGDCEVFSFHATKFFNTFEGGAITTASADLAQKLRLLRNFGFAGIDQVVDLGINGKMSEICAAMGLTGLESLDQFIAANRRNYQVYRDRLAALPGLHLVRFEESERQNYQYVVIEIDEAAAGLTRNDLLRVLEAENVLARRYFYPGCHRMEPYRTLYPDAGKQLPRTEALTERVLVLPTGLAVSPRDAELICEIISAALRSPEECRRLLAR